MKARIYGILAAVAAVPFILLGQQQGDKPGQEQEDRFVRLMSAQSVSLEEIDGHSYRRAEGPARFLHNNTWLICDTALWDVDAQIIHAMGHVSIEQERTELTSDSLVYFVEMNLAQFRGALVQLRDKDNNTLRTRNLDYDTKDSVAVFREGGSMRDKDGQLIESMDGTYESKVKLFTFRRDVNMFTDSVFIKTSTLYYDSDKSTATFPEYVEMWKDEKMFSGSSGWYDKANETFFFKDKVHMLSDVQEGWCDTVYFYRNCNNLDMRGSVQLVDTSRAVTSMAGRICYTDSLALVRMYRNPVVLMEMEEKQEGRSVTDTVYFSGDTLSYWTVKRCDVDSAIVVESAARLEEISDDPVANIRRKAAEEAAKRAQELIDNDPNAPPELKSRNPDGTPKEVGAPVASAPDAGNNAAPGGDNGGNDDSSDISDRTDTAVAADSPDMADSLASKLPSGRADSLALSGELNPADSLDGLRLLDSLEIKKRSALDSLRLADSLRVADSLHVVDSLAHRDTTKIGFVWASGNVRIFKKTMQAVCDSLLYNDLDSLARMFKTPIIWNEKGRHQYNSDSLYAAVHQQRMDKAYLLSEAFIQVDEDGVYYDQIRSAQMTAFFDPDSQLERFDAMGDVTALFFIKEDDRISSANRKSATIMSVDFNEGEIDQITYFESPKSDVYPVAQMSKADMTLKGADWRPQLRPKSPADITSKVPVASERRYYEGRPRAEFRQTELYFKGYMGKVYREIARTDSLKRVNRERRQEPIIPAEDSLSLALSVARADSLLRADSLHVADSLVRLDSLRVADSLSRADSLLRVDSLSHAESLRKTDSLHALDTLDPKAREALEKAALKERKKAEAQAKRDARQKAREAHWKELDERDAKKLQAREEKKKARKEKREAGMMRKMADQKAKEDALVERYKERYLKKARKARKGS